MSNFQFLEGKAKASVVDGMKWNQPLLHGMTRLVDDSERRANKEKDVTGKLGNAGDGNLQAAGMGAAIQLLWY